MKYAIIFLVAVALSGCVSNRTVPTTLPTDYSLNCEQLQYELTRLGAEFEDVKDESGVTGKNVALAVVFWPGIIFNEVRVGNNEESVNRRIQHLSNIYAQKCIAQNSGD